MIKYNIINNFLDIELFKEFQGNIFNKNVPWYYKESQTGLDKHKEDNGYFTLNFFNNFKSGFNNFDNYLNIIYKKLNCRAIIEVRANLVLRLKKVNALFFHTDYNYENSKTAIFYMNTNNGSTVLNKKELIKINSVENTMLIFDSKIDHALMTQTDTKRRIVININYF